MFVSASPDHWCKIPELENLTNIISLEERKALSLPYRVKSDGRREYDRCTMYDVNYTAIVESWLHSSLSNISEAAEGSTLTSFSTIVSSNLIYPPSRLPPPPVSNPDWPVTKCRYGWSYDTKDYDSTLVTEVTSFSSFVSIFILSKRDNFRIDISSMKIPYTLRTNSDKLNKIKFPDKPEICTKLSRIFIDSNQNLSARRNRLQKNLNDL